MSLPGPALSPRRRGSLGCFGVFCIFCMLVMTVVAGGLLLWINPDWFDGHVAFWRGPIYPPEAVAAVGPPEELPAPDARPPRVLADGTELLPQRMVQADYDPASGATLRTPEGCELQFPPGAIDGRQRLRLVPIDDYIRSRDPAYIAAGPFYKLFVGPHEHYRFGRPLRVRMRYAEGLPADVKPVVVYGVPGRWLPCPSSDDRSTCTVTGDVPACSGIGSAIGAGAGNVKNWAGTQVTSFVDWLTHRPFAVRSDTYSTAHFKIYYMASGGDAPPADFPLRPAKAVPGVPHLVVLLGEQLEAAYNQMHLIGLSGAGYDGRVRVYGCSSYGETPPDGGPITITTTWKVPRPDGPEAYPPDALLLRTVKATAVHEYIHVLQYRIYGTQMARHRWWMEMSAAYLADLFWQRAGQPVDVVRDVYMRQENSRFITQPFHFTTKDPETNYCWGSLLHWLDRNHSGAGARVTEAMYKAASGDPDTFAGLVAKEAGQPVGEVIERLAVDYYRSDKWHGRITPLDTYSHNSRLQAARQGAVGPDKVFHLLTAFPLQGAVSTSWAPSVHPVSEVTVEKFEPLTAVAFIVHVERLTEYQKAKVVLEFKGRGGTIDPNLTFQVMRDTFGRTLPPSGAAGAPQRLSKNPLLVEEVYAPGGTDHITVVVTNRSTNAVPGLTARRWGLLRPTFVESRRQAPPGGQPDRGLQWLVTCDPTPLGQEPAAAGTTWKRWRLYRRGLDEKDFPKDPVAYAGPNHLVGQQVRATVTLGHDKESVFTATLEDIHGNESYPAIIEQTDPFVGTWSGSVRLVEGSLANPTREFVAFYIKALDEKEQAEIARMTNAAQRAKASAQWEQQKRQLIKPAQEAIEKAIGAADTLAKIGIPVEFEIDRDKAEGDYLFGVSKVLKVYPTEMKPTVPMKRIGRHALAFAATQPSVPGSKPPLPIHLRLHRANVIRDEYVYDQPQISTTQGARVVTGQRCKVEWDFKRVVYPQGVDPPGLLWQLFGRADDASPEAALGLHPPISRPVPH